jgi:hypothetical protein
MSGPTGAQDATREPDEGQVGEGLVEGPVRRRGGGESAGGEAQATAEGERPREGVTRLRVANGPLLRPVLCRVISMVLTRADWPVDRLDEALLVCDAICAHAPAHATDGTLTFSVHADEREAELCVQELAADGAERLVRDTGLPLVGNVLERVAERVEVRSDERSSTPQLVVVISSS